MCIRDRNNSGKKKIVVAAILAALAMTNASISMAANTLPTNLHATAVGLGDGASVTGDKAVGFGQNAAAAGGYSIAIGSNSSTSVNSPQGIAIGGGNTANEGARVIGEQAIAIGGNTIAPVSYTHLDVYKRQIMDTNLFIKIGRHYEETCVWLI